MNSALFIGLASVASFTLRSGCNEPLPHMAQRDAVDPLRSGERFTAVCKVGERGGDGTLIAPDWVLTAGHVAEGMYRRSAGHLQVYFDNGAMHNVRQVLVHPRFEPMGPYDIALLHLESPVVGVPPVAFYTGSDELHRPIVLAGHGDRRNSDGSWVRDGRLRAYTNVIDAVDSLQLLFDYDAPGAGATEQEGTSGPGDSGGPAFIGTEEGLFVAGISSMGEPGVDGPCSYGAVEHFVRVSHFQDWIRAVMDAPEDHPALVAADEPLATTEVLRTGPGTGRVAALGDAPRERAAQRIVNALGSGDAGRLRDVIQATYAPEVLVRRDAATILQAMPALVAQLSGARLDEVMDVGEQRISLRMVNEGHPYVLDLFFLPSGKIEQMAFGAIE
ncbi:MAG: trypsin-like serine protease [Flavobacteriales bacterium]|nr:trypsin-like serine protease [Flavobacteriales bacterium]MCB9166548.1 trypsin-like serine protease [Flavobacteriales bacterium]